MSTIQLVRSLQPSVRPISRTLNRTSTTMSVPFGFGPQNVESFQDYRPGGFHPIAIGDCFSQGRYRVVHKLGYGGSSTVWLARDHQGAGRLVALKAMRADASSDRTNNMPAQLIPNMLKASLPPSVCIQTVDDHLFVQGPNGSHLFLVSPLAGPNIAAMSDCPGQTEGSRRLRADLARKVAKQVATALYHMHRIGVVHGDLTTSNILFSLSPQVHRWSDDELYATFGRPRSAMKRVDGQARPGVPAALVEPIDDSDWTNTSLLQESVILTDFGQSYSIASPPPNYQPATVMHYYSPETRFEGRAGLEADVWALGCAIFEIRAGFPLFGSHFAGDSTVLKRTVEVLGRLPNRWWNQFKDRAVWFKEDGEPRSAQEAARAGVLLPATRTSIREELRSIGTADDPPTSGGDGPMIERSGVKMREEEVELLGDLLGNMLKYRPEERIRMREVMAHPWFSMRM